MLVPRVDGHWLPTLVAYGDLQVTERWGLGGAGPFECKFSVETYYGRRPYQLRFGKLVEVFDGTERQGLYVITDIDWESGDVTATGVSQQAKLATAFDSARNTTSVPDVAVQWAINRGVQGLENTVLVGSISNTEFTVGGTTQQINTVGSLLDAWATSRNAVWGIGGDGYWFVAPPPGGPKWNLMPGATELGNTTEEYASEVNLRWTDGNAFFTATASDSVADDLFGHVEFTESVIDRGAIDATEAQAVANALLDAGRARPGFTNSFTPHAYQLLTAGGAPAALGCVKAGDVVRVHGIVDDYRNLTGAPYLDMVVGELRRTVGEQTIQIQPLGAVPTDFAAVIESMFREAA